MPEILGTICTEIQELRRVASIKRKTYQEISVPNEQVPAYLYQDWTVVRQSVTRTRLKKPKANAVLFEDRIWMIFYQLGFQCMNTDRNCKLKFNGLTKQVDVLAKDD